jgi:hypothetical protein
MGKNILGSNRREKTVRSAIALSLSLGVIALGADAIEYKGYRDDHNRASQLYDEAGQLNNADEFTLDNGNILSSTGLGLSGGATRDEAGNAAAQADSEETDALILSGAAVLLYTAAAGGITYELRRRRLPPPDGLPA